ncbi:hypothetical protein [Roseateles asaccharophilus]|uniref:Arc/MetJ family transcription regulator n=1 Tax=Roseateles asaccharophilus TaxID=582607 RepID=A0ABU2AEH3_9BURK|nr:hypothetical protein [Roseateles asaccharophilus]MDR7334398.1 Arc/MetJ family transcription regulator [Roseateles asaccharophilus]
MASSNTLSTATVHTGQDRLVLDNLIRRELKVGDPSDPQQVAQALLQRYSADPRAQAIGQESRGLPFLQAASAAPPVVQMLTAAGGSEWQQALDDINVDLEHLSRSALLKDVAPELRGWGQAIRAALSEGYNAARFALDPRNRDKGFAMRRQLNDYARLARLVGAHTPAMLTDYRKLAQSLDEAANLLLVIMGEALANVGFGGGRYVPQVAYSDLQTRRDAVIYALRNLVGSTQQAYGPEDWPRGLDAYRQLNQLLDSQGQSDLRSLLVETELARTMDELVQRSGDTTSEGLRAVGSTATLALERFRRMVVVARRGVSPESPALYAFLEALQLFASAFDSAGGFRLMKIARPPILFYGLYGSTGLDPADRRLVDLVTQRGLIADGIDCSAESCCQTDRRCLVLLDKVLYDLDRAIDLYSLGFVNFGAAERRASAYGFIIEQVLNVELEPNDASCIPADSDLRPNLEQVRDTLWPDVRTVNDEAMRSAVFRIGDVVADTQRQLAGLNGLNAQATAARQQLVQSLGDQLATVQLARVSIDDLTLLYRTLSQADSFLLGHNRSVTGDAELDAYLGVVEQELCLQQAMESNWDNLVHSLVANCSQIDQSLSLVQALVREAVIRVSGRPCTEGDIDLPPTLETTFDTFVERVDRLGNGRPSNAPLRRRR